MTKQEARPDTHPARWSETPPTVLPTVLYLRGEEVGERLGLSTKTLANWRARGTGPAFSKFGGAVRYRLDDVLAWEAARFVRTLDHEVA